MGITNAGVALVVVALFNSFEAYAQNAPVVGGGEARGTTGTSSFTIGQTAYSVKMAPVGTVSEGMQQPYSVRVIAGVNEKEIDVSISVYPNPSTTVVNVKITRENRADYTCQLLDAGGRLLMRQEVVDAVTSLPLEERASGAYTIQIMNGTNIVKSFNIIKKQ